MFTKTYTKVITPQVMVKDSTVHVSVYSNKTLSEGKAMDAARKELRGYGFLVTEVSYDPTGNRAGMVSARIS